MKAQAIPSDLFRKLAKAKTDEQLDRFIGAFVTPAATNEIRTELRSEQREIQAAVHRMDRIPKNLKEHHVGRIARGLPKREAAEPNAEKQAEAKHRYWEFSVLASSINAGLARTVSMSLSVGYDWVPLGCHAKLVPSPRNVAGVCWLQFAEAARGLANEKPEQKCEQCGAMYTPGRKATKGAPVRFCSSKCRMAHFYARRER